MGADAPYLYDAPSHRPTSYPYSDFNPKAVTQASYEASIAASRPKPKQEGPLINFNRHPDSYMVVPSPQREYTPLPASTKNGIVVTRWVQFGLKILSLLVAVGVLICVICIKGTQNAAAWILRIAPAWDCLITLYAVFHLFRPAKSRPAMSSASYNWFAACMDVALIPFYVYIAYFTEANWHATPGTVERWRSFFPSDYSTDTLLLVAWILAAVVGGLHLISIPIDLYLAIVFGRIAHLPPDMNPLENNLTSRKVSKHKYKNSEMTASTVSVNEKHPGYASTVSLGNPGRQLTARQADTNVMPFGRSRTNSAPFYNPHNPESARQSRQQFEETGMYQQSNVSVHSHLYSRAGSTSPPKRDYYAESIPVPVSDRITSPRPDSFVSARSQGPSRYSTPALNTAVPAAEVRNQQKEGLLHDNWYVMNESRSNVGSPAPEYRDTRSRDASPGPQYDYRNTHKSQQTMVPPPELKHLADRHDSFEPQPLSMNPPSPLPPPHASADTQLEYHYDIMDDPTIGRALTSASLKSAASRKSAAASSVYSESAPSLNRVAAPKSKYYGDLAAAQMGVRGHQHQQQELPRQSPATRPRSAISPGPQQRFSNGPSPSPSPSPSPQPSAGKQYGARVISRSGADIADENVLFMAEEAAKSKKGKAGKREVSGKVAEEGRGSAGWGMRFRQPSGVA